MLNSIINAISQFLLDIFGSPEIVTVLISMVPIVEARLAIPMAISYGIEPFFAWLLGFLGSAVIVPILLLILLPILNFLRNTKTFKKIGDVVYERFEKRSNKVYSNSQQDENELENCANNDSDNKAAQKSSLSRDTKIMIGVFLFVAVPMPLTGVWTGSAIAAICGLKYYKAVIAVIAGNLVASVIITLLSVFFAAYINTIIMVIGLIAIAVVISLIIKIIFSKPKQA